MRGFDLAVKNEGLRPAVMPSKSKLGFCRLTERNHVFRDRTGGVMEHSVDGGGGNATPAVLRKDPQPEDADRAIAR
jgi:hypothetical protein